METQENNNDYEIDLSDAVCLVGSAYGIYIPQTFAGMYGDYIEDREAHQILLEGPDNEDYWECWLDVVDSVVILLDDIQYSLYEDGDLWAIPVEI